MTRKVWTQAGGLWSAQLVQKASILVFSFLVGRTHGSEGIGVMASVLALAWIVGTIAGMGLPDRSVFRGAERARDRANRRLYGSFLCMVVLAHAPMVWMADWMGGVAHGGLDGFARGLVVGAGAHCASAVGLGWLRGAGRPGAEIAAMMASAFALVLLPLAGAGLGLAWAVSGGCMLVGSVVGNRVDGLLPAAPALPGAVVREGVPFLLYGLGAWWIGNVDVVLARAAHHPDDVGALQVGTMAVRGLALIPWVAATLMLRPLAEAWDRAVPPRPVRWVVRSSGVGLLVAALAWVVMPFLALGHQVPMESIERTTWASMMIAPTLYAFVFLVPVAAHWHLGRTLKALSMGAMTSIAVGAASFDVVDAASKIAAAGVGQLVAILWLLSVFRRPRAKGGEMGRSAVTPSV
ncbi:MAG: hypothetical protein VX944_10750 [Myxococcota bacterium]|nr:hypothetical protein [Myxococcota bacterium]MEC9390541.1 hypothetical protein [Myxococcota bacterium]